MGRVWLVERTYTNPESLIASQDHDLVAPVFILFKHKSHTMAAHPLLLQLHLFLGSPLVSTFALVMDNPYPSSAVGFLLLLWILRILVRACMCTRCCKCCCKCCRS